MDQWLKWEEAEQDYIAGMKYKDIAAKYGVALSTVKSWKARKWSKVKNVTENVTKKEKVAKKVAKKVAPPPEIVELDKSGLTDKQKAFAIKYVKSFNATQAYMTAYGVNYDTAQKSAYRLLANDGIKKEIDKLRKQVLAKSHIEVGQVLADIAKEVSADLGDYVDFGGHDEYLTDEDGNVQEDVNGKPIVLHRSYTQLKDASQVDTSLIKKVTVGKDGPVIELYDKQKAREQLLKFVQFETSNRKAIAETDILEARAKELNDVGETTESKVSKLLDKIADEIGGV